MTDRKKENVAKIYMECNEEEATARLMIGNYTGFLCEYDDMQEIIDCLKSEIQGYRQALGEANREIQALKGIKK